MRGQGEVGRHQELEVPEERVCVIPRAAAACAATLGAISMASSLPPLGIQREGGGCVLVAGQGKGRAPG